MAGLYVSLATLYTLVWNLCDFPSIQMTTLCYLEEQWVESSARDSFDSNITNNNLKNGHKVLQNLTVASEVKTGVY